MKLNFLTGVMALTCLSLDVSAQCAPDTRINELQDLLPGNTVCATRDGDRWQEEHRGVSGESTGQLWDYKMGPVHPVDPSKQLGTWAIGGQANSQVTYTYTAFGDPEIYTFEVHQPNSGVNSYNFCGIGVAENIIGATIQDGANCP
ncbi:hypothetical protein ACPZRF_14540 [Alkalicoccus sp. WONF2802]